MDSAAALGLGVILPIFAFAVIAGVMSKLRRRRRRKAKRLNPTNLTTLPPTRRVPTWELPPREPPPDEVLVIADDAPPREHPLDEILEFPDDAPPPYPGEPQRAHLARAEDMA
jgi:hypothetical protein